MPISSPFEKRCYIYWMFTNFQSVFDPQGSPQFIVVDFGRKVEIKVIQLMFQGGFVGKTCKLLVRTNEGDMVDMMSFYPEDINPLQIRGGNPDAGNIKS
ncbi:Nuclear receptor 2C2-associated protein [Mortierella sp. GBA43]|nr:Nuclear receptor 2C2-associated protein [Mortierella sp. GBA43]